MKLGKWLRKWSACLPPGLDLQHPHNCHVVMVAHLSSQLLEGIPHTSCLARLDKLSSSGFKWSTLSPCLNIYSGEIMKNKPKSCVNCRPSPHVYATCACTYTHTPTIHIYTNLKNAPQNLEPSLGYRSELLSRHFCTTAWRKSHVLASVTLTLETGQ